MCKIFRKRTLSGTPKYVLSSIPGKYAITDADVVDPNQTVFAFYFLQAITITLIKASLLSLYWRIFPVRRFQYAVYVVGIFILAVGVETIFGFIFQFTPVAKFWRPMLLGYRIDRNAFIVQGSASYMVTDFVVYLMPLPIIWNLQMNTRRRVEISIVFLIGGL